MTPTAAMIPARSGRRRIGSKHDRTGCLTCRHRHKKCVPNTFPVCGTCKRLNLECIREPIRRILSGSTLPENLGVARSQPQYSVRPMANIMLNWTSSRIHNSSESSKRQSAMKFYVKILSPLLAVTEHNNCFISEFLPMAFESCALSDALVAWSAGHLASLDDSFCTTALEARSGSLRSLAMSLHMNDLTSIETNAATSLVLMTSEVCLGDHTKWYNHLVGLRTLIMLAKSPSNSKTQAQGPEALKQSAEGQWILRNFAYHDILGSVTQGKRPLIPGRYLEGITDVVDTYLGVATEILIFISEIGCLDLETLARDVTVTTPGLDTAFGLMQEKLQQWNCPPGACPALKALAHAYRSAAMIYLCRRALRGLENCLFPEYLRENPIRMLQSKIEEQVEAVAQHATRIKIEETATTSLLGPLFIAGAEATNYTHINMIRVHLDLMVEKRQFQNILRAREVLEKIWSERRDFSSSAKDYPFDWQGVLDRQESPLLLT